MEAWKEHYHPIPIGRRLIIVPAWLDSPEPGRIPIKIDPGMAFGTGTHPTTQMSLELLEKCFVDGGPSPMVHDPSSVIDVGCGSGILSIAALKLGAARALGVDIDPASMENARANARANGIGEALMLGLGSVEEVRLGKFDLTHAPLVLANILAPVIVRLFAAGLDGLISPGGTIILSGILQEQTDSVLAAARAHGLTFVEQRQMGDWVALALTNH
jgi:ribosomal protein L11 methyltransferase